jgi:hypothetical protein
MIRVSIERDPARGDSDESPAKRRYKDSKAMYKAKRTSLIYRKEGKKYVPLRNVSARQGSGFTVSSGKVKVRASTLRFKSGGARRSSYYIFLVYANKKASWYAEIECSVNTNKYSSIKKFFESEIPKSIKIDADKIE